MTKKEKERKVLTDTDYDFKLLETLYSISDTLLNRYASEANATLVILSGDTRTQYAIELIEGMYYTIHTSLQYRHYKRAIHYLVILKMFAEKAFPSGWNNKLTKYRIDSE